MKVTKLKIENFRCFRDATFEFARTTTVFIGKNGTGKSSLIKGLCDSLSFIFNKSNNSWGYSSLAKEVKDLGVANINVREIYRNYERADYVSLEAWGEMKPAGVKANSGSLKLKWELRKNAFDRAALQTTLYKDAYIKFREHLEKSNRYPLLVYYSDRYPHVNTNLGANVKAMLNEDDDVARTWGYYHWDEFTSCTEIWQKRFIKVSNNLMNVERKIPATKDKKAHDLMKSQREKYGAEIGYVTRFLKDFSDNRIEGLSDTSGDFKISSISVDGATDFYIKFTFADGVERSWDELPAGLERLFSIVFDMAYRSYILNRGMAEPGGIVMIDELDLHLHPSLQQDVLLRFTHTFPDVQFIIATHSPLIATNLRQDEANRVYKMERKGNEYSHRPTDNLFTHDYAYTLFEVMQTEPRNFVLSTLSERYIRLSHRGKNDKAEEVRKELRKLVGRKGFEKFMQNLDAQIAKG